jgi:competence protein ComEC
MVQEGRSGKVRLHPAIHELYEVESRRFVLWLPVCLGLGISVYFALPDEPRPFWGMAWLAPLALIAGGLARRAGWGALALAWLAFMAAAGFGLAILSTRLADAPQIRWPMGETVAGRVLEVSRSASGAPRLLIDRVVIYGVEPEDTPARLRVTLLDEAYDAIPLPGQRIRVYASLMPNGEPVEPGAFDFRRRAFFERIGGIGLSRGHLLVLPAVPETDLVERLRIAVARTRAAISRELGAALPGRQGAIASALIVGDRADIDEADNEALRISSLAHILSISGLHMAILTGLVFGIARLGLAAIPWTAYRLSTKKAAALAALLAGLGYLALSGASVPTQRAFVMVAVALVAVFLDRPAISMRGLALSAAIILVLTPASLLDAGFQMSFAATAALVAGYEALRQWRAGREPAQADRGLAARILWAAALYIAAMVFTSLLAGSATAPFAAYHFNRTAPYGLVANMLALPVMSVWITPAAGIAGLMAPFGWAGPALGVMGAGIEQILVIAHWVAGLPGADQAVRAASPAVLAWITLGGLWLALWRGRWRLAGLGAVVVGIALWANAPPRPELLVAPDGRLIGLMGPDGRVLDNGRAHSFAAEIWLRRDGDQAPQPVAAARPGLARDGRRLSGELANGWRLEVQGGRPEPADLSALCRTRTLLIARNGGPTEGECVYFGENEIEQSGALAVWSTGDGLAIRRARDDSRGRLWAP